MTDSAGTGSARAADGAAQRGEPGGGPRRTALFEWHQRRGARLADFGGWLMPIEYPGGGVLREHQAVRERVGVFDVSHLGKLGVTGPGAAAFLDACLTNDLQRIAPGTAQYTLCCDDTGGAVDDLFLYLHGPDDVLLVPNAANAAEVARRLRAAAPPGIAVADRHHELAVLAVQGPESDSVLAAAGLPVGHEYLGFRAAPLPAGGGTALVCRTGYTGERGYEVIAPAGAAAGLWERLVAAAERAGGLVCGLGARDTLRTEMGYPLHGQDLSREITPVQAGLGWAVGWRKPRFWGREALIAERAAGPARRARGLLGLERGVPRPGCPVRPADSPDGAPIGWTTSGTFSPTLRTGIALALLDPAIEEGAEVSVEVRGRPLRCRVVRPPFVPSRVR